MKRNYIIAIDGPGAAGKSTIAKIVAKKLNYTYIDTGAMYRSLALYVLKNSIDINDEKALATAAGQVKIFLSKDNKVFLNDEDVTDDIRSNEVTAIVSPVSRPRVVREIFVKKQQELANASDGVVMDGRDIGTVVLPNADIKIYQVASVEVRALRRYKENLQKGIPSDLKKIEEEIEKRDYSDMHKEYGALKQADDALYLDTSNMSIDEVVDYIINLVNNKEK